MILRSDFLKLLGVTTVMPNPSPSPKPWEACLDSGALPYDRPLGLKMRVLDGPDFDLLAYRGKPVLINVFASWCGPCNAEMPYVVEAGHDYANQGLAVIGINDREEDNTVRRFRGQYGITFPIAMDANGGFVRAMESGPHQGIVSLPYTFFIDPNGYLFCIRRGGMTRHELRYRIEQFLAASSASPAPALTLLPSASPLPAT